ncbi:MAG: hypothetical protein VR68_01155 [Peptococcaceae bacterium BRH_c4a]|nr:MAG: hypothetical protein VR68_01155 [Peptococcaceae bacterium BRH_c4a]
MQLSEAVLGRRSIRKFKNKPVPEGDILEIIRLASHAPSAGNQQMWHFTVITGGEVKTSLASAINETFKEIAAEAGAEENRLEGPTRSATFFRNAPVLIAVSTSRYSTRVDETLLVAGRSQLEVDHLRCRPDLQSIGAVVQTLLLGAFEKGLGTCYMTGPMGARFRLEEMLDIKPPASLAAFVAMGYPDMEPGEKKVKDISQIVTFIR